MIWASFWAAPPRLPRRSRCDWGSVLRIVRLAGSASPPHVALRTDSGDVSLGGSVAQLLALPLDDFRELIERAAGQAAVQDAGETVLAPVDGLTEVWAAGVTYQRSRTARMLESEHEADIYDRVYEADRPELFFKAAAWRVVGPSGQISVRADSTINVPEPELAVVANRYGQVVGYTVCNDVSSRSIEGENPLYLPQAKVYLGSCALGPGITPVWEVPDPCALAIELAITRGGEEIWSGTASTDQLHRRIEDLLDYLFRADEFPGGVVLATGTCLVPELPFTLVTGDVVRIGIAGLGELNNPVVTGKPALEMQP
ncbi:fumarylacetoacetate hydrolase family protein [Acidothermaceae bacterium B102]|nr:fumarylacetoacetate hydrolase family protein [Acidothermaceae bacterium B102]